MKDEKQWLKVMGIINILIATLSFSAYYVYGTLLFISGIILYLYSKEDEETLKKSATAFLLFAVILIPLNFIASIILFVINNNIQQDSQKINGENGPPVRIKKIIDPEYRKVDILLKIGVGMVFISGIIFATTSWDFITDILKVIILIALGGLFITLSIFTERKLRLYRSSYMYWILSMSFFLLSVVSMLYFGVFSDVLSYSSDARAISYGITFFTITGLATASYLKFPKKYLLYLAYASTLLTIVNILRYFIESYAIITIIVSVIAFIVIYTSKKETTLSSFMRIIAYSLFPFILYNTNEEATFIYIASITNIVLLTYITNKYKDTFESVVALIISYILIISSACCLGLEQGTGLVIFSLITINTLLIKLSVIKVNEAYHNINYAMYIIISLAVIVGYQSAILSALTGLTLFIINLLESDSTSELQKIGYAKYIEPLLLFIPLVYVQSKDIIQIEMTISEKFIVISTLFCIIHYLTKNKNIYRISIYIITFLTLILDEESIFASLVAIVSSIYLYYFDFENKEKVGKNIANFIFLYMTLQNALCICDVTKFGIAVNALILIGILFAFVFLTKRSYIKKISYFLIVIPLFVILEEAGLDMDIQMILLSTIGLYVTFILSHIVIQNQEAKNVIGLFGVVLSLLSLAETSSVIVGLYIGIVGLAVLIIGYYSPTYKSFFITGIIITVLNIIYQLREFWEKVPFWLYLLFGGLSLIGFVTYKELNKNNKK